MGTPHLQSGQQLKQRLAGEGAGEPEGPTCPWLSSWKMRLAFASSLATTACAGTRAKWQDLHSVTAALLPSRQRSWKSVA